MIWVQKIWFENVIWFEFDFILCDLIWWFEQITTFGSKNNDYFFGVFTAVELNCQFR